MQVDRVARKGAEVPLHRRADSMARARAGLRRVLGRRARRVDQDRLSRFRGDRRDTWGTRRLHLMAHSTLMRPPQISKEGKDTGSE